MDEDLEIIKNRIDAYYGSKTIDTNYSGSLVEGIEDDLLILGRALRSGISIKKDIDLSIKYLCEAVNLGNGDAAEELGHIFKYDNWVGKKTIIESHKLDHQQFYDTAVSLWKSEVNNGKSDSAWSLYNFNGSKEWARIAIELAEKYGNHEDANFMKQTLKENSLRQLKNDLLTVPVKHLEIYFRKDPPGGHYNSNEDKKEIKAIQKNLLRTISEIKRPLNEEEKKEIERLRNLGQKEV